jgi:hypothetical protein
MQNFLFLIVPYRYGETWVFDDENFGFIREPFVFGIPEMIDHLVQDIPNAVSGFRLLFSQQPFPGYQVKLVWLREEYQGNWYIWPDKGFEGWLCPALYSFFPLAPVQIYCKAEPKL